MSTAVKSTSWFRFRLRTLLLLVTLVAIPCAWIGSQWKLVRERSALIDRVEAAGGEVTRELLDAEAAKKWLAAIGTHPKSEVGFHYYVETEIVIEPGTQPVPLSTIRRWLGDRNVTRIRIPSNFPDDDEKRALDLFPQATVVKFYTVPKKE